MAEREFPKDLKYICGGTVWTVLDVEYEDNTEMRRVMNASGDVEIMTLITLRKDANEPDFSIISDPREEDDKKE
tara:strand:+ start:136 stop:357 length:222 start_codon:yes stop_codon:yes gene_type:complete